MKNASSSKSSINYLKMTAFTDCTMHIHYSPGLISLL